MKKKNRILVTGSSGQLANEIKLISGFLKNQSFIFLNSDQLDITNLDDVVKVFKKLNISDVINCAAYTNVDKAENEFDKAYDVNCNGIKNLLQAVGDKNGRLIHFSTDYVFDGKSSIPYKEKDATNPKSNYGKTKLLGEKEIIKSDVDSIIIRTSWLYSRYGNNFVKKMLNLSKNNKIISVVNDQKGSPTYAHNLAQATLQILINTNHISKNGKVYHYCDNGIVSWFDFAKEIFKIKNVKIKINPVASTKFKTLAKRPSFSVLENKKIIKDFYVETFDWKFSLKKCLNP